LQDQWNLSVEGAAGNPSGRGNGGSFVRISSPATGLSRAIACKSAPAHISAGRVGKCQNSRIAYFTDPEGNAPVGIKREKDGKVVDQAP